MKNTILIATVVISSNLYALDIVSFNGSKFDVIPAGSVQEKCGDNFAFRDEFKDEAPQYLHKAIVKASFTGKLVPSFENMKDALKGTPGKCGWVASAELSKLN